MGVGDLIAREPEPAALFAPDRATPHDPGAGDGRGQTPHPGRGATAAGSTRAQPPPGRHRAAFAAMGLTVATLAGNHTYDSGEPGVLDTVEGLRALGISTCGAGAALDAARRPAVVERRGARVGVLSYNTVGPRESWA